MGRKLLVLVRFGDLSHASVKIRDIGNLDGLLHHLDNKEQRGHDRQEGDHDGEHLLSPGTSETKALPKQSG